MTLVEIVLSLVKIIIIVGFLLQLAPLAVWADRRQSAMMQDRVGPNRAVVYLPSSVVRLIVMGPPALFGVIAAFAALKEYRGPMAVEVAVIGTQLAVLVAWFGLVVLCAMARSGGPMNAAESALARATPRSIFLGGLVAHSVAFVAVVGLGVGAAPLLATVSLGLLAALLFVTAVYSSSRVPDGKVAIRLAGTLHSLADAIKLIWKEDFVPKRADRLLHSLAPILAMFPALVAAAVIPFGNKMCFRDGGDGVFGFDDLTRLAPVMQRDFACPGGHVVSLQIADLNVGLLFVFAMVGTGVIGAALAGWASDNKWSLLGGLRAAGQMVSYEVAMGLSIIGALIVYGSIRLQPMVEWQANNAWGIFVQPLGFVLFLAALVAETKRVPFDQPEGESEIVAGYFVEYSGMKFGMFFTGEYVALLTSSALLVTLFFGGFAMPFLHPEGLAVTIGETTFFEYRMTHLAVTILGVLAFFGKVIFITFVQVFFRWTLPRFRYDQVMKLGWTKLLPLAIGNILVTAILVLAIDGARPEVHSALKVAADLTQVAVALAMVAGVVAVIVGLLEPVKRERLINSTTERFAQAAGGTKASPQGA